MQNNAAYIGRAAYQSQRIKVGGSGVCVSYTMYGTDDSFYSVSQFVLEVERAEVAHLATMSAEERKVKLKNALEKEVRINKSSNYVHCSFVIVKPLIYTICVWCCTSKYSGRTDAP